MKFSVICCVCRSEDSNAKMQMQKLEQQYWGREQKIRPKVELKHIMPLISEFSGCWPNPNFKIYSRTVSHNCLQRIIIVFLEALEPIFGKHLGLVKCLSGQRPITITYLLGPYYFMLKSQALGLTKTVQMFPSA